MEKKKLVYVMVACFSTALIFFFTKLGLNYGHSPLSFIVQTNAISVLLLTSYIIFSKKSSFSLLDKASLKYLLPIGALMAIGVVGEVSSLNLTTTVNYSFLNRTSVVFTIVLAFFLLKEKLGKAKIALILPLFLGVYLVTTRGQVAIPHTGDLIAVGAALLFSFVLILQKLLLQRTDPYFVSWGRALFTALILFFSALLFSSSSMFSVISIYPVIVAVFITLANVAINKVLEISTAAYFTMMAMSIPLINLALGWMFLGEIITPLQLAGGMLILLSGILVQKLKI